MSISKFYHDSIAGQVEIDVIESSCWLATYLA
jgi:hypothetical protein